MDENEHLGCANTKCQSDGLVNRISAGHTGCALETNAIKPIVAVVRKRTRQELEAADLEQQQQREAIVVLGSQENQTHI